MDISRQHRIDNSDTGEGNSGLSHDMYAKAFRFSPDPMAISTLSEARYVDVNDSLCRYLGYSREEVIGRSAFELGIWECPADRERVVARVREQGILNGMEMQFVSKSGRVMTGLLSADIIDLSGQPHIISIIQDVTAHKDYTEASRLLEERFSKAFNASPIPLCISTVEEGTYIDINECYCRISGYSREELLGKTTTEQGLWLSTSLREQVKTSLMNGESVRDMETDFRTKSGKLCHGLYSAERIDVNGQSCILSILVDLTEYKQMEREIARLDQLNLIGQMAANLGHEIRNPMTTVRGYLQILRPQEKYREESETIDLMIEEIDQANAIITQFLSLARDKLVQLNPADLNVIIGNLLPFLKNTATAQDKCIEIKLERLPYLLLDKKEIGQLITNLVNNGLEAMPPGGILRVRTYVDGQHVVLSIKDEGSGMSQEVREKLGTPFFTTKENRTGLGMAVCFGIARRHNADIDCSSYSGGTTMRVLFPYSP